MKKRIGILFLAMAIMAILPLISAKEPVSDSDISESSPVTSGSVPQTKQFRILDTSANRIVTIEDKEFCIGAVAYEMPSDFCKEALKAQCVACYTHFSKLRENAVTEKADFSADLSKGEYYIKNLSAEVHDTIAEAVEEVFGEVMTDDEGNIIDTAYHAISGGQTENAKDIFGFDSPYLQAVSSAGDVNVSGYLSTKEVSADTLKELMLSDNITLDGKPDTWIKSVDRTPSGTVRTIQIGNKTVSGAKIREMLSLRSANFDIKYNNQKFILTVYGYGHGVGMSQYGAECMAQQGADYTEILRHYYNNVQLAMSN